MRRQSGFSVVELLAVLAVLAVLTGIVVVAVGRSRADAQASACEAELQSLRSAVRTYQARTGFLPSNDGILVGVLLEEAPTLWEYRAPADLRDGTATYLPFPPCA